jgi:inosose dehydratase
MEAWTMKLVVGTAPDSWGVWFPNDPLQTPWQRYLDEVARAGYQWTELGPYGYLPTDPATLSSELERRGLKLLGGTMGGDLHDAEALPALREQAERVGDLLVALGGMFLVLLPSAYRDMDGNLLRQPALDKEGWGQLVDSTNDLGRLTSERFGGQLQLAFHSHGDSHVEYAAQLETLLEQTDPEAVKVCMDTGHYVYRDGDLQEFMRRHHARTPYLHIKTVDGAKREQVLAQGLSFVQATRMGAFCEPPGGIIDWPAFADVLREIDYNGYAAVEQDLYPCDFDVPLPIATRTCAYLKSIGLG